MILSGAGYIALHATLASRDVVSASLFDLSVYLGHFLYIHRLKDLTSLRKCGTFGKAVRPE